MTEHAKLVEEHLKLQQEFHDYVKKNGFKAAEFYNPPAGSFFERYRKRWSEITEEICPVLTHKGMD
jgi:hypothetical protein